MNRILLFFILLSSGMLFASEPVEAYRKEVKPFLETKELDAYGNLRYHLINRYDSMVKGTFYGNAPELKALAEQELEQLAVQETVRLRSITGKKAAWIPVPVRKKDEYPQIEGANLVQNVVWPDGRTEKRPVYLFGFGAFGGMWNDIDFLGKLGINYIQGEIGPNHIYPEENRFDERRLTAYKTLLGKAERYGILMDLLISPHYIPKWFLEKNPDADIHLGGFLRVGLNRPATAELMRRCYSRALPELAAFPALYSVSVTNEPVAFIWHKDADTPRLWEEYLTERYRFIGELNRKWGADFADFKAVKPVLVPPKVPYEFDPRLYDWSDFNARRLASWIGDLGNMTGEYLPGKPQSSKMIQRNFKQYDLMQGVDVFHFTRNGNLNGFDGGTRPDEDSFLRQMVARSLLQGARKAPLVNTEHHLLRDRNTDPVPEGFVRAAFFIDALTGLNGSVAWNWDWDGSNPNSIFIGLFRYRPRATEEYIRTGLDLMRLAPEAAAISGIEPEVGILYSRANILWNQESVETLNKAFAAVSAIGVQPVMIPDQVLAAGEVAERFPRLKVLILPDVKYLPEDAFAGLEVFMQNAFHSDRGVLLLGGAPVLTPYGKKRDAGIFDDTAVMVERCAVSETDRLPRLLEKFGAKPGITLCSADGKIARGMFFRTAEQGGRRIAAAVNIGNAEGEFHWQDGNGKRYAFTDLAALVPAGEQKSFKLAPWQVVLGELK